MPSFKSASYIIANKIQIIQYKKYKFGGLCQKLSRVIYLDITKREKTGLIIFVVIILLIISISYFNKNKNDSIKVLNNNMDEISNSTNENETKVSQGSKMVNSTIKVYIIGEVNRPGVYSLLDGEREEMLVKLAGGFTTKADTTSLNLAMKLKDEDKIIVPNKSQIPLSTISAASNKNLGTSGESPLININSADKERLKELPRIGDALSQRIIDYREKMGAFKDIKDISKVSGIGTKMFDNIKDKITIH